MKHDQLEVTQVDERKMPLTRKAVLIEIASVLVLIGLTIAGMIFLLALNHLDLTKPITYIGGDDMANLENAQSMIEQTWNSTADRLGAPFVADYYSLPTAFLHNFDLAVLKIFCLITANAVVAVNMAYFTVFVLSSVNAYIAMRLMKVRRVLSMGVGLMFAFSPYLFARELSHFTLSQYYFIPFAILICVWLYNEEDYLIPGMSFLKDYRTWLTLAFCILIANNGIIYYQFFSCFAFILTGVAKAIHEKKWRYLFKSFVPIAIVVLFMVIALIPFLNYVLKNGMSSETISRAGFGESEVYGLQILQMFIPLSGQGIGPVELVVAKFNEGATYVNENVSSYLGIAGCIGFIITMLVMVTRRAAQDRKYGSIVILSCLNFGFLLLGVSDGLGTMFSFLTGNQLRGYNRISIFIMFVSLAVLALFIDRFLDVHKRAVFVVFPLFTLFTAAVIWQQYPADREAEIASYQETAAEWDSDAAFVAKIEADVPEGSMIYELPYHPYPESGPELEMNDYDLMAPYLHSKSLRWSYGNMKGTASDSLARDIDKQPTIKLQVEAMKKAGFAGVYIDLRGYLEEEGKDLISDLEEEIGNKAIKSDNGNLAFIKF